MKKTALLMGCTALAATAAFADPDLDAVLEIDGVKMETIVQAEEGNPLGTLISGWHFRNEETQILETDDFENPSFAFITQAEELWEKAEGTSGKSCADCHGEVSSFKGLRAGLPKWNAATGRPMNMEQLINWSRKEHQGAEEWKWESAQMQGMNALIALQSRGLPVKVSVDGPMQAWWERGKQMYYTRTGQLDFSCANCHEENTGKMLRADHLSQGHLNGFPLYRLKWQAIGSSHRRLEGCITDTRAETYPRGSDELLALEVYVSWRGNGLSVESPAVRN